VSKSLAMGLAGALGAFTMGPYHSVEIWWKVDGKWWKFGRNLQTQPILVKHWWKFDGKLAESC